MTTEGRAARASYGPWLSLFCASVSWRVLVYFIDGEHLGHVPTAILPSVERAEVIRCREVVPRRGYALGGRRQGRRRLRFSSSDRRR